MALVCDHCGMRDSRAKRGVGWWQVGQQFIDRDGRLLPVLVSQQDYCCRRCLEAGLDPAGRAYGYGDAHSPSCGLEGEPA